MISEISNRKSEIPPAEELSGPPALMGPAVKIAGGPYNGLKGNLQKQAEAWCSVVIEFEHKWFEIVTRSDWLTPLAPAS